MKTLFINLPSFKRYDSAGARFAAARRTSSIWYPIWLAYGCAVVKESVLLDCPAENIKLTELYDKIKDFECLVCYVNTPSIDNDIKVIEYLKDKKDYKIIMTGPHASVFPEYLLKSSKAIDAAAVGEFEYTVNEYAQGKPLKEIKGLAWRNGTEIILNSKREPEMNLDKLPFVSPVYRKYADVRKYHLPFALEPYLAIYTGRGCPYKCSFCLWPQTFTGRTYRKRSVDNVIEELKYIKKNFPELKEIFFDDDTFTVKSDWLNEFCEKILPLEITWSVNARGDLPLKTLIKMKKSGCRLLVVGYESGNQNILNNVNKNITVKQLLQFTGDAKKTGLLIHGTFVLGLPGENRKTIMQTHNFSKALNCDTIQVSIAAPLPGTEFYKYCKDNNFLKERNALDDEGFQNAQFEYPGLTYKDLVYYTELLHTKYYFRIRYFIKLIRLSIKNKNEFIRILLNGFRYLKYLYMRNKQSEGD